MGYQKFVGTALVPIFLLLLSLPCKAQLSTTFYDTTCPTALAIINASVVAAVQNNGRNAALLIRLLFHDCFVQVMIFIPPCSVFGSHTLGQAQCVRFRERAYNATNIDPAFATTLRANCPQTPPNGDGNLEPLDLQTPNIFDNNYFENLVASRGLLISDQALFDGGSSDSIVTEYVNNPGTFDSDFAAAMVKMSEITPLTGKEEQFMGTDENKD
ncbi:hypothetical protein L1987_62919 [Smallanthus sonchifolius]|uniref:Uncharacterized protein n=1 Tax=Smallanthus sonchifolius TaxID=185202 RepID=A0ACB9CBY0_9ASTR|nr:hypothetical protein L1987_62919 [Smallanthus sonchifolius]